jgi:hypothetical protein
MRLHKTPAHKLHHHADLMSSYRSTIAPTIGRGADRLAALAPPAPLR